MTITLQYLTILACCMVWDNVLSAGVPVSEVAAVGIQHRADKDEEEGKEDADGESTENVDQHVWVAALPEHSTQHLCRVIPEEHVIEIYIADHGVQAEVTKLATYLIQAKTTGMLPNTTPVTQEVKHAVTMTPKRTLFVEVIPISRCTQRIAMKVKRMLLLFNFRVYNWY